MQLLSRLALVGLLMAAAPLWAQTDSTIVDTVTGGDASADTSGQGDGTAAEPLTQEELAKAEALPPVFEDQEEWEAFATRVTAALQSGRASNAVFADLRSELADWRDIFLDRESVNADRIATLTAQIAALGPVPDSGEEDLRVAARRTNLNAELDQLQAPAILAAEAHTQANGLIGEIDNLIRDRQAEQYAERSQSPLNPTGWGGALSGVSDAIRAVRSEVLEQTNNPSRWASFNDRLPAILALLAVAMVLVLRGRSWIRRLGTALEARTQRGQGVVRFVLSLGQVILPVLGLAALSQALLLTGMAGRRLTTLIEALPQIGLFPILAHWLAGLLLPRVEVDDHPLGLSTEVSTKAHRQFVLLGYAQAAFAFGQLFATTNGLSAVSQSVLLFPLGAALAWVLYWLGHSLRRVRTDEEEDAPRSFRQTLRGFLSIGLKMAAVIGVVAAAIGYAYAIDALVFPAANTLYLLGLLLLLQRLSVDTYTLLSKSENGAQDALMPVLIGFLLVALSLPVLAIIWGAQLTDLTELWTRFQEGFAVGETRISPTSFLLFAVIFVVGYTVTRLFQAALRTTVLPRTNLDLGAQNAIVAGLGYVGIFVAAIIAITMAGIDLSGLAIVAGALSVGIGFGLQNIVSNFVAGIILLIERPISEGDWIEVGDRMGYVRGISVRSTRIETFDRTDVIIPNADLVSGQVTNWTRGNSVGRVIVPVGVAYGTDTDKVTEILKDIAESHPMVLMNPAPGVLFRGFGADSLDFEIRAILRDVNWVMAVHSDMNHQINKRFAEAGIEIPFAQRDVWLRNPETLRDAAGSANPAPDADDKDSAT